jgi:hypothetical protein
MEIEHKLCSCKQIAYFFNCSRLQSNLLKTYGNHVADFHVSTEGLRYYAVFKAAVNLENSLFLEDCLDKWTGMKRKTSITWSSYFAQVCTSRLDGSIITFPNNG